MNRSASSRNATKLQRPASGRVVAYLLGMTFAAYGMTHAAYEMTFAAYRMTYAVHRMTCELTHAASCSTDRPAP